MSRIWDWFSPVRGLISWREDGRPITSQRRTARLQLEQLEKREVPSADLTVPSLDSSQLYQEVLQAESNPIASLAQPLQQVFTAAVEALPTLSGALNIVASDLSHFAGPQTAQQYTQVLTGTLDAFLVNLENATETALHAAGVFEDPTFNVDVAFVNSFMSDPLHYNPPL